MKPDPKLIDSMALRYRHDFGFLDEQTQESIRITMTQLWEEVIGLGFYRYKSLYAEKRIREALKDSFSKGMIVQTGFDTNEESENMFIDKFIQSLKQPK